MTAVRSQLTPLGFIVEFTSKEPCTEWRFQGSLGFGGKFRYPRMSVDCYPEDETPARLPDAPNPSAPKSWQQCHCGLW